jgi:hypothetical protein
LIDIQSKYLDKGFTVVGIAIMKKKSAVAPSCQRTLRRQRPATPYELSHLIGTDEASTNGGILLLQ